MKHDINVLFRASFRDSFALGLTKREFIELTATVHQSTSQSVKHKS